MDKPSNSTGRVGRMRSSSVSRHNPSLLIPKIHFSSCHTNVPDIKPKFTLKEHIAIEVEKIKEKGELNFENFDLEDELETFSEYAECVLNLNTQEIQSIKMKTIGQDLLKQAILLFKYFEEKEGARTSLDEDEFHVKCVVDDLLYNFLIEPPKNHPQ